MKEGFSSFYDALDNITVDLNNSVIDYPTSTIDSSFISPVASNYDIGDFYAESSKGIEYPDAQIWDVTNNKIVRSKSEIFYK